MITAKVHRPLFDPLATEQPLVTLTATVNHGSVSKEFPLALRVKMQGVTDSQSVILDLNDIQIPTSTKVNLTLPTIGKNGSVITWTSNNSAITNLGVVARPDVGTADVDVILTATTTKGTAHESLDFPVKIWSWTATEEMDAAVALIGWNLIKGTNTNSQAIKDNLVLPGSVGRSVSVTWASSTTAVNASTGVVTTPAYTTGPLTLRLTATLTKSAITRTITTDTFIVSTLSITDAEAVASTMNLLSANNFLGANESLNKITTNMVLPYHVNDIDASKASITWSLVTNPGHTALATSPYITLTGGIDGVAVTIIRPDSTHGNESVALEATAKSGTSTSAEFYDIIIVADAAVVTP